jgi:hypothetical protein
MIKNHWARNATINALSAFNRWLTREAIISTLLLLAFAGLTYWGLTNPEWRYTTIFVIGGSAIVWTLVSLVLDNLKSHTPYGPIRRLIMMLCLVAGILSMYAMVSTDEYMRQLFMTTAAWSFLLRSYFATVRR